MIEAFCVQLVDLFVPNHSAHAKVIVMLNSIADTGP